MPLPSEICAKSDPHPSKNADLASRDINKHVLCRASLTYNCRQLYNKLFGRRHNTEQSHALFALAKFLFTVLVNARVMEDSSLYIEADVEVLLQWVAVAVTEVDARL